MRNCNALLPKSFDVSVMRDFDMYLDVLNSEPNHKGIVERLIARNVKTQNIKFSEDRLLRYDIDVLFTINMEKREIERVIQDYSTHPESARTGYN